MVVNLIPTFQIEKIKGHKNRLKINPAEGHWGTAGWKVFLIYFGLFTLYEYDILPTYLNCNFKTRSAVGALMFSLLSKDIELNVELSADHSKKV